MKIVSVVGARPQFVKLFPISRAIPPGIEHEVIHTGQHYDESLSQVFFDELKIPRPLFNLDVRSGSHAQQTAAMMIGLENAFFASMPDVVLVYGDTNSTIAAAIVASKMHLPLVHLEAGLRSFNRKMPEELNRIATDHLSDLLLAPSSQALENLMNEGLATRSVNVGDVMVDAVLLASNLPKNPESPVKDLKSGYIFCTIHRAENTNEPRHLNQVIENISKSTLTVILAAHPRLISICNKENIKLDRGNIKVISPQSYLNTIDLVKNSQGVITDSGGLQKEAYLLNKNILTVRHETEWTETLIGGRNRLDPVGALAASNWFEASSKISANVYGDGDAANKVLSVICKNYF